MMFSHMLRAHGTLRSHGTRRRNDGSTRAKSFGGLFTVISGDGKQTAWDDLRIEDCAIHDVGPIGMAMLPTF